MTQIYKQPLGQGVQFICVNQCSSVANLLVLDPHHRHWRLQRSRIARCRSRLRKERRDVSAFRVNQKQLVRGISDYHQPRRRFDQHFRRRRKRATDGCRSQLLPVRRIKRKQIRRRAGRLLNEEGHAALCRKADETAFGWARSRIELFKMIDGLRDEDRLCLIRR